MKGIHKIMMIAILALFCSSSLLAQPRSGKKMSPEERAAKTTEKMVKKLNLDEAQSEKVAAINLTNTKKAMEIRKSKREQSARRTAMESLRGELEKEMQLVLTEEQFTAWKKMNANRDRKQGKRGKRNKGEGLRR